MSKAMKNQGHFVTIITQELSEENIDRQEYADIEKYPYVENFIVKLLFPLRIIYRYWTVKKYLREKLLESGQPDCVIARDPVMAWACKKYIDCEKLIYIPPAVFAYNKPQRENTGSFLRYIVMRVLSREEQFFQELCFKNLENIVVFSENVKEQIKKRLGKKCNTITIIYPGCDDKFFETSAGYEYDENRVNFLFIGRLVEDKNVLMVLRALEKIDNKKFYFEIVGDGLQRKMLEEYTKSNQITNVHFEGKSNNPEKFYSKYDFFILPSKYESFGQVISESMACGTPIIGFKTIPGKTLTAVGELVENNVTGIVIDEFSVEELQKAILKAIELKKDKKAYEEMRKKSFQIARKRFSWESFSKQCLLIVEDV